MSESSQDILILVVDDNKNNLQVVSGFLRNAGYNIALSLNAENAMQILKDNNIDLILLDVMMPVEDGYSFCRRLKKEKRLKDIPVIFLTAKDGTDDLLEGFQAGGVDYITKPFRKEELLARVKSHVDLATAKKNIIKQSEIIKKINNTRDKMYSIISHDIKSPFANISMMISMIAEGYLEPDSDDFREIIQNLNYSTKETYALLENLLQWTRTQTGDIECNPEIVDLNELIENAISIISINAQNKNININSNIENNSKVFCDPNMIKSVMINLLSNAIKFTDNGGKIFLTGTKKDDKVEAKVKDTGKGIDKERLDKLFNKNEYFTTAGTNNEKGSGLGLHLVREFISRNGGTISVESELGEGTTFTIQLPTN